MTLAQKSDRILAQTRGLSGATPNATQLIEELRSALEAYRQENATLTAERDEARRECRLLLHGQDVLRGVRDLPAPPDDLVTIVPVPRKEDGK
jgi:cell division protein FtsB